MTRKFLLFNEQKKNSLLLDANLATKFFTASTSIQTTKLLAKLKPKLHIE